MSHVKLYAAIAAALNWDEYEAKEDGLFLQPEEATVINTILEGVDAISVRNSELAGAAITDQQTIASLQQQLDAANATLQTNTETIASLNQQVAELGKGPSGKGTVITGEGGSETKEEELTINHPDHPVNVEARRELAAKKALKNRVK